jgi:hypothetical protein
MVVDTLVNLSVGTTSTIGYQTALDIVRIDETPRLRRDTRPGGPSAVQCRRDRPLPSRRSLARADALSGVLFRHPVFPDGRAVPGSTSVDWTAKHGVSLIPLVAFVRSVDGESPAWEGSHLMAVRAAATNTVTATRRHWDATDDEVHTWRHKRRRWCHECIELTWPCDATAACFFGRKHCGDCGGDFHRGG